jgi:pyruvate,orthophosphate dikinase
MGVPVEKIKQRVKELHEFNPMLGFRGCRLGIVYPEISEMQARAVFEAAAEVQKSGIKVKPEVMIPLVGFKKELDLQVEIVHRVAKEVMAEQKVKIDYMVGTMIEIPRGALTADEIAQTAEFFSFGTNDLTQTCLGMSRDDSGSFLGAYAGSRDHQEESVRHDRPDRRGPAHEDRRGEGQRDPPRHQAGHLRRTRRRPDSVKFCHKLGLTYVSCSPFRVPVARLAAAQAACMIPP